MSGTKEPAACSFVRGSWGRTACRRGVSAKSNGWLVGGRITLRAAYPPPETAADKEMLDRLSCTDGAEPTRGNKSHMLGRGAASRTGNMLLDADVGRWVGCYMQLKASN